MLPFIAALRGAIVYRGASKWAALAPGTAGKSLVSNGAGADPSWQNVIPSGVIVMWSGTLASIPSGWYLCDGTNGTPDLRDKFVKGWAAGVDPGGTGGAASASYTPQGSNATCTFTPAGTVAWPAGVPTFAGDVNTTSAAGVGASASGNIISTVTLKAHTHTVTPSGTISWPAGVPTFSGSSGTVPAQTFTGQAASIPTEPPYYKLAYLMKA